MDIIFLLLGVAIGAIALFFVFQSKLKNQKEQISENQSLKTDIEVLKEQKNRLEQDKSVADKLLETEINNHNILKNNHQDLIQKNIDLSQKVSVIETENSSLLLKVNEQKQELEDTRKALTEENNSLKANTQKLIDERLDLTENLSAISTEKVNLSKKVEDLKNELLEVREKLSEENNSLKNHTQKLINEKLDLTKRASSTLTENENLSNKINEQKQELENARKTFTEENNILKTEKQELINEKIDLTKRVSTMKTENENLLKKLQEQKQELEDIHKKFTSEFENIANRLFEKSSEKINKQGSEQLEVVLKPFKERLSELKNQISDTYEKDTKQRIQLHEQVKQLFDLNQQISTDAQNLTNALKSNTKTQGDWGEEILENILQQSGLRKGMEYDVQNSFVNEKGKTLRPDMIVHYPDNRDIIIDSKVSLTSYERYISAETTHEKDLHLKAHLESIKQHIKQLSEKNYQDLYQIESLDFVMMFVPIEGAYYTAVEADRNLWQYAYERKIVLINPTNLITALKMISNLWQQDYQNKNVMEIARQSGNLYDRFVLLLDDFSKMEKHINETQNVFNNIQKRISTGKGNLIGRVEKIKTLGAKTKKSLPEKFKDALEE